MKLRVVCWNLHGVPLGAPRRARRMKAAARRIHDLRPWPDVILLQEVFLPADAGILRKHLGAHYQLVDDMPRRAYPPWFLPFLNLGGLFLRFRKSGLLAFVHRDWEVAGSRFVEFRTQDWEIKLWDGDGYADKGFHRLDLRHRRKGTRLCVFNTHTQSRRRQHRIRAAQIAQLGAAAAGVDRTVPVILAGDFNVRPREPLYDVMTRDLGWIDLTRGMTACSERLGFTKSGGEKIGRRRDYVFARRGGGWTFAARARFICNFADDVPYSDHHGIDAEVSLRRNHEPTGSSAGTSSLAALAWAALRGPSTRRAWLFGATAALCRPMAMLSAPGGDDLRASGPAARREP